MMMTITMMMLSNHVFFSVGISNHVVPHIPAPSMLLPIHHNHSVYDYAQDASLHLTQHHHML